MSGISENNPVKTKLLSLTFSISECKRGFGGGFVNPSYFHKKQSRIISDYIKLIEYVLDKGDKKKLYDLEKALIAKMGEAFKEVFGDKWLSNLSEADKALCSKLGIN